MRRLSRLLSRSSIEAKAVTPQAMVGQRVPLLELPTEILLLIEKDLLFEHILCLSLTCKRAYSIFFRRYKPVGKRHPRERYFLRLLERDHPTLISCPWHPILYAWPKRQGKRYRCPLCTGSDHAMVICNKACRVGFYGIFDTERRLMIRHAFLGPQYGISLRSLNHVCKRSKAKTANQVTPKVVGRSLMVWRTHHYATRIDFDLWTELGIDLDFNEAICVHSDRAIRTLVVIAIHHARRRRQWLVSTSTPNKTYLNRLTGWSSPIVFKCPQCATDVRIRMDQTSPSAIVVQLDVFQDLGGLHVMTVAQQQVLGMRFNSNHKLLTVPEKVERLRENLEKRFFEESEVAEKYCDGIPWHSAFLSQWFHNLQRPRPGDPVLCWQDDIVPGPIWRSQRRLRFKQERGVDGHG